MKRKEMIQSKLETFISSKKLQQSRCKYNLHFGHAHTQAKPYFHVTTTRRMHSFVTFI